jgi:hypothetical protein
MTRSSISRAFQCMSPHLKRTCAPPPTSNLVGLTLRTHDLIRSHRSFSAGGSHAPNWLNLGDALPWDMPKASAERNHLQPTTSCTRDRRRRSHTLRWEAVSRRASAAAGGRLGPRRIPGHHYDRLAMRYPAHFESPRTEQSTSRRCRKSATHLN